MIPFPAIIAITLPRRLNYSSELNINIISGTGKEVRSVFVTRFPKYFSA